MPVIEQNTAEGSVGYGLATPLRNAGAPVNGTDEIQSVDITGVPTGGDFTLTFDGYETAAIAFDANAAAVEAALDLLPSVPAAGAISVSGTNPNFSLTFDGVDMAKKNQPQVDLGTNNLTGGTSPTVSGTTDTPGVTATHRGAALGAVLIDETTKKLYINEGTAQAPTWTVVGTQT